MSMSSTSQDAKFKDLLRDLGLVKSGDTFAGDRFSPDPDHAARDG
jgi:hypothetical protein